MFGSFSRAYGRFEQPQFTRVKEPTLLCNQVLVVDGGNILQENKGS